MSFQLERARQYLHDGTKLYKKLPGRMGIEIKTIVKSGLQVLTKLDASRGNVFVTNHQINPLDLIKILYQTTFRP